MNYFGTQIPEVEKIDGHMQIETINTNEKDLNDPKDQFTVSDLLLSENPVILIVKDKSLIEYTLANLLPFRDVVEFVVNDEKVT